mgnify:CR=1 FL=1
MSEEPRTNSTHSPLGRSLWVVGAADPDCSHPTTALTELGSDGVNDYYRCADCTGVVVFANGTTLAAGMDG